MRKAILDLGTNTFHLMIAEIKEGEMHLLQKVQTVVKIGEGGINKGFISDIAYQRALNALIQFSEIINTHQVSKVITYGTSAIRDAKNGPQFMDEVYQKTGLKITSISGDLEARLIYKGISHSFELPDNPVLVMDIGGGSVEFIIGNKEQILWCKSYPIGAARLIDKFKHDDPISDEYIVAMNTYFLEVLQELIAQSKSYEISMLIGSAGSFETLHDVLRLDVGIDIPKIGTHAFLASNTQFQQFYKLMTSLNLGERKALKGMLDFRVDMIVVSAIMIDFVCKQLQINELIVSEYALKEGMFYSDID